MDTMDALAVEETAPQRFHLAHLPVPTPAPHEALIEVHAVGVNPTDLALRDAAPPGAVLGHELAGVVRRAAADGSGPPAGARVAGLVMGGAWALQAAAPAAGLAEVPRGVDLRAAATVPLAAVSALRALRAGGAVLGRQVMITGATGAVGALAVRLASLGGAAGVTAVARSAASAETLRALGATDAVTDPRQAGALADIVIDTVGGAVLTRAFAATASGGTVVSVGRASGEEVVLPADALEGAGGRAGRTLRTFFMPDEPGDLRADLGFLLRLVDEGRLEARVDHVEEMDGPLPLLRAGRWTGTLVLTTRRE
jgi:NADPH:quinone reductase-like Zn-dependent oxidoreductase